MTSENNLDLNRINASIADRSDVFYWQTDRAVEPEEAGHIWADRHRYFTDDELLDRVNAVLLGDKLASIQPLDQEAQTNLGNVSSVRVGVLEGGDEVIMRCFPKGILNGYFHAEAAAAEKVRAAGLPTYQTFAIHDFEGGEDFAFHVLQKLPGFAIQRWLEQHPEDEDSLIAEVGATMARMHTVSVTGFGPFDNEKAKSGQLIGLHETYAQALRAGLPFNLNVLVDEGIFTPAQSEAVAKLFTDDNPLLQVSDSVLVHNDFADWNLLTDGKSVTGILDYDECVGGDPVSDIACWSTFFEPKRMDAFLKGYFSVANKPADFEAKFELLRLRYTVSKMTLRIRRYTWSPSEDVKKRIENGKEHLAQSLKYFKI